MAKRKEYCKSDENPSLKSTNSLENKKGKKRRILETRIAMTDKKTIEWIRKQFNFGSFFITKRKNKNNKWNDLYHWEVTYQKALKVLKMIQPYLITKKEICDKIMLELLVR